MTKERCNLLQLSQCILLTGQGLIADCWRVRNRLYRAWGMGRGNGRNAFFRHRIDSGRCLYSEALCYLRQHFPCLPQRLTQPGNTRRLAAKTSVDLCTQTLLCSLSLLDDRKGRTDPVAPAAAKCVIEGFAIGFAFFESRLPGVVVLPCQVVHLAGGLPVVQAHGRIAAGERCVAQGPGSVLIEPRQA
ncbi:hypothetical protein D3C76_1286560 [compost metagenome]